MPGQDSHFIGQGQRRQHGKALLHLGHAAARQVHPAAGTGKQSVTAEHDFTTDQADAAGGMPRGAVDCEGQFVDG